MNPFKRMREIDGQIARLARKHSLAARKEIASLKKEATRLNRIIDANPGLCIAQ